MYSEGSLSVAREASIISCGVNWRVLGLLSVVMALAACSSSSSPSTPAGGASTSDSSLSAAKDKIKHVIVVMQENRSFDSYFGTYPGADGIPMQNGTPTACVNDPTTNSAWRRTMTRTSATLADPTEWPTCPRTLTAGRWTDS